MTETSNSQLTTRISPSEVTSQGLASAGEPNTAISALTSIFQQLSQLDLDTNLKDFINQSASIRSLACQLDEIAESYSKSLALLEHRKSAAVSEFEKLKVTKWLKVASSLNQVICHPASGTVREHLDTYGRASSILVEINSYCDKLDAMVERLATRPEVLADLRSQSLEHASDILRARLEEVEVEFARRRKQEADVAQLLDALFNDDSGQGALELAVASSDLRTSLFLFVAKGSNLTEHGQRFSNISRQPKLAGCLLRFAWPNDSQSVRTFVNQIASVFDDIAFAFFAELLAFLQIGQLHDVVKYAPHLFTFAGCIILRNSIRYQRPTDLLMSIPDADRNVPALCIALFEEFQHAAHRQQFPRALTLARRVASGTSGDGEHAPQQLRDDLLDYISRNPGLTKYYHELRLTAQHQLLKPMRALIEAGNHVGALEVWENYGDLDSMVDDVIRGSGIHRGIVGSHRQQTRNYLAVFEAKLMTWVELAHSSNDWHGLELTEILMRLSKDPNEVCRVWWSTLREVLVESPDAVTHCSLGDAIVLQGDDLFLDDIGSVVSPYMHLSWRALSEGRRILFSDFVFDKLRLALGRGETTPRGAVESFMEAQAFTAAVSASEEFDSEELLQYVWGVAAARRREIEERFMTILEEAREACEIDEYVALQLQDVNDDLCQMRFFIAEQKISQLDDLLVGFRTRKSPEYLQLVNFLSEVSEVVDISEPVEGVRRRVADLRDKHRLRRIHIVALQEILADSRLPDRAARGYRSLLEQYDTPSKWPCEHEAQQLCSGIRNVTAYISSRRKYGEDAITESLPDWLHEQIELCLNRSADDRLAVISVFEQTATEIASPGYPEQRITQLLGLSASRTPTPRKADPKPLRESANPKVVLEIPGANAVVSKLRMWLSEYMRGESTPANSNVGLIRSAMRNCEWRKAREFAAAISLSESSTGMAGLLSFGEAVYAMCRALDSSVIVLAERITTIANGCLAVACSERSELRQNLSSDYLTNFIAWCFTNISKRGDNDEHVMVMDRRIAEEIPATIARLSTSEEANEEFQTIAGLLGNANRVVVDGVDGCAFLAETLWEATKGAKDPSKARSDLLTLLFRLRRYESIQHLVQYVAAGTQDEVRSCLQVVQRLPIEPSLYHAAAQRFLALRERSSRKANTRSWIRFFELQLSATRQPEEPLTVVLESEFVVPDSDGKMLLEIELRPSVIDPPQELCLEVSDPVIRTNLLESEHDFLTGARVITVAVPSLAIQEAGSTTVIPYRIFGRTLLDRRIDIRDVWELPISSQSFEAIDPARLKRSWPGFAGDPVRREEGFHGRRAEIELIEGYLTESSRPRSAMLFGQRRIGKTSLLLQLVNSFPPQVGHVCAVFVDLSGLHIGTAPGALQTALFQKIITDIETKGCNELAHQAILGTSGRRLSRIVSGIEPDRSLAGAMEELVREVQAATNGRIGRMAFLIDEFDRFVEPMLSGRASEVEELLWAIRAIVQQSDRVSLVLAGSGLQRVYTGEYDRALYGSIDEIEIKAFNIEVDRSAIEDTFLPKAVRKALTSDTHRSRVVDRAFSLTGGHPYFLAMLGYAAAQIANGHMLTPALLNRVVEKMIHGAVVGVSCSKFYHHVFDSLKYLPIEQRLAAQVILCRIALMTTAEIPWIQKLEAINDPALSSFRKSILYDLLRILSNEGAIESDDAMARVRIMVPITASAIRKDGERLKQEAMLQLDESRSDKR